MPHKVRYYLQRRDAAFGTKMAEVFCVYRELAVLRAAEVGGNNVVRSHGIDMDGTVINVSMIESGLSVASLGAGAAMAAIPRSSARTAGHSRCR
jgi:hypothetical protein